MYSVGKVLKINKRHLLVETDEDIDLMQFQRLSDGGQPRVGILLDDQRNASPDQIKKLWAIITDFCSYTGYSQDEAEAFFKKMYMLVYRGRPDISFSFQKKEYANVTEARIFIDMLINYMLTEEIPFSTKTWDEITISYAMCINCLLTRQCLICGNPADIAHYEAVGRGNRNKVDHRNYRFMALCRIHHEEQHTVGVKKFCQDHLIKPVKMNEEQLMKVGLMTRNKILNFDKMKKENELYKLAMEAKAL
ncbi:putative HNHc nuclease [Pediococcus pentosaceus]|uniref:putative HNHc nuclease n=1 Tax=Pediococcus pentosaceus TaxID=1255 RepID=UPI002F261416